MTIGIEKCCCGHKSCSTYWLTGIGHFCQGSGFEKDEAELIVKALAAYNGYSQAFTVSDEVKTTVPQELKKEILNEMSPEDLKTRPKAEVDGKEITAAICAELYNHGGLMETNVELLAFHVATAIRPLLTPCADVAGLVEKLKKCPRVYGLETEEAISIIKQHFGSKP